MMRKLKDYLCERVSTVRMALLVLLLVGGSWLLDRGGPTGIDTVTVVAIMAVLVVAFRLLDDLADVEHDRIFSPERVLVRAESLIGFRMFCGVCLLLALTLALILRPPLNSVLLLAYTGGLLCWYGIRRRCAPHRLLHSAVILSKYPLMVYVACPEVNEVRTVVVLGAVFGILYTYELLHDPGSRSH